MLINITNHVHCPLSSSSGAVFFEKVDCHDPPWLPILSKFHEVFVSYSRPFCDVCHPLCSWPSSDSFPIQWTIQQQPVDVVTSDHVTKVGNFSFLYCWNYVKPLCKAVRLPVLGFLHLFCFASRIFSPFSDMPTFQTIAIFHISGGYLLSTFHIRIKVSTTHMLS